MGIIFGTILLLGHYKFISVRLFKVLAFEAKLFTCSRMTLSLKLYLKLVEFNCEKVKILRLSKNDKNFVNDRIMESCFGKPTFYSGLLMSVTPKRQLLAM